MFDPRNEHGSYDSWGTNKFGAKSSKTAQNYENYRNFDLGSVQFRPSIIEEDESGVCSPPLWKTSPPRPPRPPRHLSSTSRTQAIARGQWELMEMVKSMPESSYELSLKDLVEHTRGETQEERLVGEKVLGSEMGNFPRGVAKRQESNKVKMVRNGSTVENRGLFLKMVIPFYNNGSKRKKKVVNSTCAKVSPKPEGLDRNSKGGGEKDWWRKKVVVSGEGEISGGSISNSSSSRSNSGRKMGGFLPGCWSFFCTKKSQTGN